MTPDKIYVNIPGDYWHRVDSDKTVNDIEYIRKDTLLEWLKLAVECYSHPDTVNVVDTIRCEGKKWAFQNVINKIESL